jgi:Transglycosylase SLT domain
MRLRAYFALVTVMLALPAAAQQPEVPPPATPPATEQSAPAKPDKPPPAEAPKPPPDETQKAPPPGAQNPAPAETPKSAPTEAQKSICMLIESAARANGLPVEFFARVIWQESRFQAGAVGPVTRNGQRAQGIAQFMPGTAAERNLLDPMDPVQALPKSAEFLRDLRAEFGNLGLAAAAYNAGPRRVRDWIAGRGGIPAETRNYVFSITGSPVDQWSKSGPDADAKQQSGRNCATLVALLKREPSRFYTSLEQRVVLGAMQPWGSIVGADSSRDRILSKYAVLQQRYSAVLSGLDPILIERRRGPLPRFQVRVGAQTRAAANDLCLKMHKEHGDCVVLRNPGG